MPVPPSPSANQGTQGVSPSARYSTIPARARRQPRAAAPSSTAKAANPSTRTASRTRSPGSTSASTSRRGRPRALCDTDTGCSFSLSARLRGLGGPTLRRRAVPSRRPLQLGEAPLPAGLVPVAALGRLPLGPDHHMQGPGEDLLVAAGAAVHLGRPVWLHEAQVPAVRHPLQGQRLAPEPPRRPHHGGPASRPRGWWSTASTARVYAIGVGSPR